jgi:hypothetical protein
VCLLRKNNMNKSELHKPGQALRGCWWTLVALAFCALHTTPLLKKGRGFAPKRNEKEIALREAPGLFKSSI